LAGAGDIVSTAVGSGAFGFSTSDFLRESSPWLRIIGVLSAVWRWSSSSAEFSSVSSVIPSSISSSAPFMYWVFLSLIVSHFEWPDILLRLYQKLRSKSLSGFAPHCIYHHAKHSI
jgi:hypothetical protein